MNYEDNEPTIIPLPKDPQEAKEFCLFYSTLFLEHKLPGETIVAEWEHLKDLTNLTLEDKIACALAY